MKSLEGKIAIVTGASSGIGRAIAIEFAQAKCTVVLAARNRKELENTAKQVEDAGGIANIFKLELQEEDSIRALLKYVGEKFGKLDILVNNAGITHSALLEDTTTADWDTVMSINVRGAFILCREALGLLKKADSAKIINISSVVGVKGYPMQSAYTASKHALRGMSISLANELKDSSVRVHVICPGGVDTGMAGQVRPDINKNELISPQEIAELVGYLAMHHGNGVVDELRIRRATSDPWF